ncbi:MAG: VOC family protein [Bacteroidota bacterium]|nr:VOC family protein [Bacteroidota bacterium]
MTAIEVISVPVTDQQASKEFYLTIGFQLIVEADMGNGSTWVQLGLPGQTTSITLVHWFKEMPAGSMQGLVLKSTDIEKEVADLKAKGVEVKPIDDTPWGRFASFSDPNGNGLTLHQ